MNAKVTDVDKIIYSKLSMTPDRHWLGICLFLFDLDTCFILNLIFELASGHEDHSSDTDDVQRNRITAHRVYLCQALDKAPNLGRPRAFSSSRHIQSLLLSVHVAMSDCERPPHYA